MIDHQRWNKPLNKPAIKAQIIATMIVAGIAANATFIISTTSDQNLILTSTTTTGWARLVSSMAASNLRWRAVSAMAGF